MTHLNIWIFVILLMARNLVFGRNQYNNFLEKYGGQKKTIQHYYPKPRPNKITTTPTTTTRPATSTPRLGTSLAPVQGPTGQAVQQAPVIRTQINMRIVGGVAQGGITAVNHCLYTCSVTPGCRAADFSISERICRHHTFSTICEQPTAATGFYLFNFVDCLAASRVPGGILQTGIISVVECISTCDADCRSVEFRAAPPACFHHGGQEVVQPFGRQGNLQDTACGRPIFDINFTHFRKTICPDGDLVPPVDSVVSTHRNVHILGGTLQPRLKSEDQCRGHCASDDNCQAVDFDSNGNTCWFHSQATACSILTNKPTCVHYKLRIC